jgi:hypothetical protein
MERKQTLSPKVISAEYDLNLFYAEEYDMETTETTLDDNLTCQPSVYAQTDDGRTLRFYLDAFKLDEKQTKSIAHRFPEKEWGSDFFLAIELFLAMTKDRDPSIDDMLAKLPDPMTIDMTSDRQINWLY